MHCVGQQTVRSALWNIIPQIVTVLCCGEALLHTTTFSDAYCPRAVFIWPSVCASTTTDVKQRSCKCGGSGSPNQHVRPYATSDSESAVASLAKLRGCHPNPYLLLRHPARQLTFFCMLRSSSSEARSATPPLWWHC